jgi:hypothetical protein
MLHFLLEKYIFNPKLDLDFFFKIVIIYKSEKRHIELLDQGCSSPK